MPPQRGCAKALFPPTKRSTRTDSRKSLHSRRRTRGHPARSRSAAPAVCARETSAALGLDASAVDELAEADHGRWRGRRLIEVADEEPAALAAWTRDPDAAPHGGESFNMVCSRVGRWLDTLAYDGTVIAITHAQVIRAAIVQVLSVAPAAFARIEIAPLSIVELGRSERGWIWRPAHDIG